ncbi:MAG: hypothetical protein ACI4QB_02545, partial [Eubacteriales bacterium]
MQRKFFAILLAGMLVLSLAACAAQPAATPTTAATTAAATAATTAATTAAATTAAATTAAPISLDLSTLASQPDADEAAAPKYVFLFIGDGMSYPQFQAAADYLGAIADEDYAQSLP